MDQTPLNHLWRFPPGTCGDHQGSKVSTHNYIILFHFFQQFWNQFTQFCNQQVSGFQVFQVSRVLFQFSQPTQNIAPLPEPKRETRQSLLLGIFHGNWGNQNRWKLEASDGWGSLVCSSTSWSEVPCHNGAFTPCVERCRKVQIWNADSLISNHVSSIYAWKMRSKI